MVPFSPHPCQLVISCLFDNNHFNRCEVIEFVVLICISLMIGDVEYLFMYLLAIGCLLWKNINLDPLPIFLVGSFGFLLLLYEFFMYFGY